ncbi:hypothetical protein HU200_054066 [Digitaria exilis]|uniref:CASP-like protein n=1 Tax=Digitaria exilis TaxID=1010633 RepID=A0A835ALG2_9POAL|nr:hypothetical protein HU200_054066 [Digitaria exilis]
MTCKDEKKKKKSGDWRHPVSLVFRIAAMGLAVAAAAVMATASQCTVYVDYDLARPRTITFADFKAFVYLVVATAIAAGLEAVAIFLSVFCKKGKGKKVGKWLMPVLAAVVPALLYTSAGAAFAAGWDIFYYMEPTGRRLSICSSSIGSRFCKQVHVSMWLSLGAALAVSLAELVATWPGGHGGAPTMTDGEDKKESKAMTAVSIAGRIIGMGLAVAAAVLMSTASQCTIYYSYGTRPRTVTYADFPPFVYLVIAAAMAAFLEGIAIFLAVWKKGKDNKATVLMPLLGAAVPALLYSAAGAAFAAGADLSYCSAYGKRVSMCAAGSAAGGSSNFCSQVHIAVILSLAAAVVVSVAEVVRGIGVC